MRYLLIALIGLLALSAGLAAYALWVPGTSAPWPTAALTDDERQLADRLKSHIISIASEPHNVRHPEALERSAVAVEAAFREIGLEPQRQEFEADGVKVRNIWVTIEPRDAAAQPAALVIGAHYDSDGIAPGANDNASGTASILELARMLKDFKPQRTRIYLVAFVNEESPYWQTANHGALRFADLLLGRGEHVRGMISLETLGWFSNKPGSQKYPSPFNLIYPDVGNFVALVAMPGSRTFLHEVIAAYRAHASMPTIGGVAPSFIPGIAWSDHAPFADRGVPALMMTDTAPFRYPHYHRATDTPDKVDVGMLARITKSLELTLRDIAH